MVSTPSRAKGLDQSKYISILNIIQVCWKGGGGG